MAQLFGMTLGVLIVALALKDKVENGGVYSGNFAVLCPADPDPPLEGKTKRCSSTGVALETFIIETAVTFIFVSVICNVKFLNDPKSTVATGLTVGLTLTGLIIISGAESGGCINTAVGLVQSIFQHILFKNRADQEEHEIPGFASLPIYVIAPTLGGVLAGFFHLLNAKNVTA